jgi:hypothetical protein
LTVGSISRSSWTRFLMRLAVKLFSFPYVMIFWDYNKENNKDNGRIRCVELDNNSIMKSIYPVHDPVDAGCLPEWNDSFPGGCDENQYALQVRGIKKGDEILFMDYEEFIIHGWKCFGLEEQNDDDEEEDVEDDDEELQWWESDHWTNSKGRSPPWTSSYTCLWSEASPAERCSRRPIL